jgi:hypothetical protein
MNEERAKAFNLWCALRNLTVERGATEHEAETAAKMAARLKEKWGFGERIHAERPQWARPSPTNATANATMPSRKETHTETSWNGFRWVTIRVESLSINMGTADAPCWTNMGTYWRSYE